jgi:hypothetical protein
VSILGPTGRPLGDDGGGGVSLLDAPERHDKPEPRRERCPYGIPLTKVGPGETVEVKVPCTFERFTPDRVVVMPARGTDLSRVTFDVFASGNGCDGFGRVPIVLNGRAVDYRIDAVPSRVGYVEILPVLGEVVCVFRNEGASAVEISSCLIGWALLNGAKP